MRIRASKGEPRFRAAALAGLALLPLPMAGAARAQAGAANGAAVAGVTVIGVSPLPGTHQGHEVWGHTAASWLERSPDRRARARRK
jgi:hypothetical protein